MRHPAFAEGLTGGDLARWYRRIRERTNALLAIPVDEAYHSRPIELRNPIVFYDGHLPAFAINTLVKFAQNGRGIDGAMERLFERGIDPEETATARDEQRWPDRNQVRAYTAEAERRVEDALLNLTDAAVEQEAAGTILEHELMHQETLVYLLHNLPWNMKNAMPLPGLASAPRRDPLSSEPVPVPAGVATLGAEAGTFGWDNEFPQQRIEVEAFTIDRCNVTNDDYLAYMRETGASAPHFWIREGERWSWRGMFSSEPLDPSWPVFVTHHEAEAFARWRGGRLPTEAEYHRAASGAAPASGNFGLQSWSPQPVGSHPEGASSFGVHDLAGDAWEWTSTLFHPFHGFEPMVTYPAYSADFFDDAHFVLKGASLATPRELIRPSFRNWFRPRYPYVYAKFRLVH